MSQPSHRIIGVIRIEPPVADLAGGDEDDSTIGGLLARFAQQSLLAQGSSEPWWYRAKGRWNRKESADSEPRVPANLNRLLEDLEKEFAVLSDVVA